jgi:mRNA interferase HigB
VHVITRKRILEFSRLHPDSRPALEAWHTLVEKTRFLSFPDLRKTFPSADWMSGLVVFNIGGNKYRLIAAIHFNRGKLYIRHILTHAEYDKGGWRS